MGSSLVEVEVAGVGPEIGIRETAQGHDGVHHLGGFAMHRGCKLGDTAAFSTTVVGVKAYLVGLLTMEISQGTNPQVHIQVIQVGHRSTNQ